MTTQLRQPEDMIWYYWEATFTEASTAHSLKLISNKKYEEFCEVTRKTQEGGKFTLELRVEACNLEYELEQHRSALTAHYKAQQEEFMKI